MKEVVLEVVKGILAGFFFLIALGAGASNSPISCAILLALGVLILPIKPIDNLWGRFPNVIRKTKPLLFVVVAISSLFLSEVTWSDEEIAARKLQSEAKEHYATAITCIGDNDYNGAANELQDIDYEDSAAVLEYCNLQNDIEAYKNNTTEFKQLLNDASSNISNENVKDDVSTAIKSVEEVGKIQNVIDQIELSDLSTYDANSIEQIDSDVNDIDARYHVLLEDKNLETAKSVLTEIENKTALGTLILAIDSLDKTQSISELDKEVSKLNSQYEGLTDEEREKIVNYNNLESMTTYVASEKTKQEEAEAAAKAKEEAEAKAAAEKAAKANASASTSNNVNSSTDNASASNGSSSSSSGSGTGSGSDFGEGDPVTQASTYVLNANTKKFHYAGCKSVKRMKESNRIYSNQSRDEIIAQGYEPCENCHP